MNYGTKTIIINVIIINSIKPQLSFCECLNLTLSESEV